MPTNTYTPLATITLTGTDSEIVFSSIPATYRDLILVASNTLTGSATNGFMKVNSDTGNNYNRVQMWGNGSSPLSYSASGDNGFYAIEFAGSGAVGAVVMQFMDYSATDKHKTILIRSNVAGSVVMASANRWGNTNAINTISIAPGSGSFAIGSTFSLYGVIA